MSEGEKVYFFTRIGGKHKVAPLIIDLFPQFQTYVEPFVGSGQVFLSLILKPNKKYVLSDLDNDIYDLWRDMKTVSKKDISELPWTGERNLFHTLKNNHFKDPLHRLHRNLYISFYSYSGDKSGGFADKKCVRGKKFLETFERLQQKVKKARIHKKDYGQIINQYDSKDTLFYLDPPYFLKEGLYEGNGIDPNALRDVCRKIKGKFILSYNQDPVIYHLFSRDFYIHKIEIPYTSGKQKFRQVELIITNFIISV